MSTNLLLKQRLVGAVVLVALAVIFIPMLLEGPNQTLVPKVEELPEPEEMRQEVRTPVAPMMVELPAEPEQSILTEPLPQEPETPPVVEEVITPPPPPEKTLPLAEKHAALGNWVVQVGSFSNERNALGLRDKLRKSGFVTQVEKVKVSGKWLYRVRVGPFLERSQADSTNKQLTSKFKFKGRVMSYP